MAEEGAAKREAGRAKRSGEAGGEAKAKEEVAVATAEAGDAGR